jgi:hypothetical protein
MDTQLKADREYTFVVLSAQEFMPGSHAGGTL